MEQNGESKSYTHAHIHTHWFLTKGQGGFPSGTSSKEPACQCRTHAFNPWVKKIPWRRKWHPTSVFLSGKIPWTGTWRATVHRASKSWTRLSNWAHTHTKGNSVEKHTLFWLMVLEQLDIHNAKKRKKERKRIPINMQKITWNRKHIPKYSIQYIHKCKSKNYDDSSIKT